MSKHPPAVSTETRRRIFRLLLTILLVVSPVPSVLAAPGILPLPFVDAVASQGPELIVSIRPNDPSPMSGGSVDWTVTLANRGSTNAESPTVWLGAGDGLVFESAESTPPGWQVSIDPTQLMTWSDGVLEPGESVTVLARTTVSGSSESRVELTASGGANNHWWDSPRPGPWANGWVTIDGVGLEGSVASQSGAQLADVCVNVSNQQTGQWSGTRTGIDGTWAMSLPAGDEYRLQFDPTCQVNWGHQDVMTAYARQWWPGSSTPTGEQSLVLDSTTDLGEVQLIEGGAMTGHVIVPEGWDPTSVNVSVEDPTSGWWVDGSSVDSAGTWTVSGLPPGDYRVGFRGSDLAEQYYEDTSRGSALLVPVAARALTTGIDATMQEGAIVTGRVTDALTGEPIANVSVSIVDSQFNWFGGASTGPDGGYEISDLATGQYFVAFEHEDYVRVFHDGSFDMESVTPLQVSAGTTTTLDLGMVSGTSVSGVVTAATAGNGLEAGDPIPGVAVLGWPGGIAFSGQPVGIAVTGVDGSYTLTNVPPIEIGLLFVHGLDLEGGGGLNPFWAASFWPGVGDFNLSTPLDLSAGADVTGIDAALVPAPVVHGLVVDAHGGLLDDATPLDGMTVALFGIPGGEPLAMATTDSSGAYEMRSILADMHVYLAAADMGGTHGGAYAPMWYRNAPLDIGSSQPPDPMADGATPVVLPGGGSSAVIVAYNAPSAPDAPTGLQVAPGDGLLTLTWTPPAGPVESQTILIDGVVFSEQAADATTLVVQGLSNSQTYDIEVFATNLGGDSAPASGQGTPVSSSPTAPTEPPPTTTTTVSTTGTTSESTTSTSSTDNSPAPSTITPSSQQTTSTLAPTGSTPTNRPVANEVPGSGEPIEMPTPPVAGGPEPGSPAESTGRVSGWMWLLAGALALGGAAAWAVRFRSDT